MYITRFTGIRALADSRGAGEEGGEEKKKEEEWEEVFSLLFSLSRIKIPVIRYISPFSRVFLGSKTFFPALFLLRGYRFGSFVCIHMYDEKETVIKLRL